MGQWSGRKCLIVEVIVSSQGEVTLPKTLHLHLLPCVFLPTLPPMRKAFLPAPHCSLPSRNHIETHLSTCMCTNTQAFTCIPAHTQKYTCLHNRSPLLIPKLQSSCSLPTTTHSLICAYTPSQPPHHIPTHIFLHQTAFPHTSHPPQAREILVALVEG